MAETSTEGTGTIEALTLVPKAAASVNNSTPEST